MNFSGKKTYLVIAVILGYLAGIRFGLWPHNNEIDLLLFALVAAALRSAISSITTTNNQPPSV